MSIQQPKISIDEIIQNTRDDILRKQADSNSTSIIGFDVMVQQFRGLAKKFKTIHEENTKLKTELQVANVEIKKLKESKK